MKLRKHFLIPVLLLCFAILFLLAPGSWAATAMTASQQTQTIQSLEDTLFAVHYDQDSPEARIERLEQTVFGQKQTGTLAGRLDKLRSVLSPKALGPLSPLSKPQDANQSNGNKTAAGNNNNNRAQPTQNQNNPAVNTAGVPGQPAQQAANGKTATPVAMKPEPGETDYPTVSQMEQRLFGKTFVKEDITIRLSRLEKEVFKTPQSGSLADRVDNLRLVVLGDAGNAPPAVAAYQNSPTQGYAPPQYGNYSGGYGNYSGGGYGNYGNNNDPLASQSGGYGYNGGYGGGNDPYAGTQVASSSQPYYGQPVHSGHHHTQHYAAPKASGSGGGYQPASYQPGTNQAAMGGGQVSPDMLAAMSEVEKQVIGHTYPSEPVTSRLDRLENKVFKSTSPELPPQERMQRIIAVASAGGAPSSPKTKAKTALQILLPIILTVLPLILL